jgi:hypothetical protein
MIGSSREIAGRREVVSLVALIEGFCPFLRWVGRNRMSHKICIKLLVVNVIVRVGRMKNKVPSLSK